MKNISLLTVLILSVTLNLAGQNITMELMDPQPFLQGSDLGDMEFADLDSDGDMDLVITGSGNMSDGTAHSAKTTLYFNDGSGNFSEITDHNIENIRVSKIGLADIDNDSDLDLLISGSTHGGIALTKLYTNNGSGVFTEVSDTPFESLTNGYFNFGDLDNDGDFDIVFSGGHNGINDVVKYNNDGAGNFSLDSSIGVTNIQGVLDLSDFDGDDDLDLLVCGVNTSGNTTTRLYLNNGSGNFSLLPESGIADAKFGDIATGDTDGDGDLDVVITGDNSDGQIITELYVNNGSGNFTLEMDTPFLALGVDGETSFNDFDNDGDLDLFVIGSAQGGLPNIFSHIYENEGSNNFILSAEFVGGYLSTHAIADVDGDNLLDVVIGGTTTGSPVRGSFMFKNVSEVLSVESEEVLENLEVYPNPSNGIINIHHDTEVPVQLSIYSVSGQLVGNQTILPEQHTNINLDLPNGIYLATIKKGSQTSSKRLIIQN